MKFIKRQITKFLRVLFQNQIFYKVEMANQTKTFDLNEHMHDASNSGDDHLEFRNLPEDSSHKLVQSGNGKSN